MKPMFHAEEQGGKSVGARVRREWRITGESSPSMATEKDLEERHEINQMTELPEMPIQEDRR